MSTHFDYDVFISRSSKDKPAGRELSRRGRMKQDGLHVWLDEWEISPGDMIGLKISQGLERSRTLPWSCRTLISRRNGHSHFRQPDSLDECDGLFAAAWQKYETNCV